MPNAVQQPSGCRCAVRAEHGTCSYVAPYETTESVVTAYGENCMAREQMGIPPLPPPDVDKLDAMDGLYNLIQKYGATRVMSWIRNLAAIAGQDVTERPADRCLADGGALINRICVQCGRDNS
jgi:hypothetical protein